MATVGLDAAGAALLTVIAGGLNKPPANWTEVDARTPAAQYRLLDQRGCLSDRRPDDSTQATPSGCRSHISPQDFFRIVEIAPRAVLSPHALRELPAAATLLRIRTSDGVDHYFVGEQEKFQDVHAQEIWAILHKYRGEAW